MRGLIIIPAYNEEKSILQVARCVSENPAGFDYVVINDCSTDNTLKLCRSAGIPVLNLPVNLGIGGAVQTGYRYALAEGYDMAIQMDGDGQHDAAFLPDMVKALKDENVDMVIGSRFIKKEGFQSSAVRRVGIRYFSNLIRLYTGKRIYDPTSGFRLINRRLIKLFAADYPSDYPEPESLTHILKAGCRALEIPVQMNERADGTSSIRGFKSIYYMLKVSTAITVQAIGGKRSLMSQSDELQELRQTD